MKVIHPQTHFAYHHQKSQIVAAQNLANVHFQTIAEIAAVPIKQFFDSFVTGKNDHSLRSEHERIDLSILPSPFLELQMCVSCWHLVYISYDRQCWGTRRIVLWTSANGQETKEAIEENGHNPQNRYRWSLHFELDMIVRTRK
jgi:hypothetical protein